jgi:hypothetical protein
VPGKRGGDAESHKKSTEGAKQLRESRARTPEQVKADRLAAELKALDATIDEVLGKDKK